MDLRTMIALAIVGLPSMCSIPDGPVPLGFGSAEVLEHKLSGQTEIRTAKTGRFSIDQDVQVDIDTTGRVTDARMDPHNAFKNFADAATLGIARRWRFRPFLFRGRPVKARGTISIANLPLERWAVKPGVPPDVAGRSFSIGLLAGCNGNCPSYSVWIGNDGKVSFSGYGNLVAPGEHASRVDPAKVDALFKRFRELHFFDAQDEYAGGVTDQGTSTLVFMLGEQVTKIDEAAGARGGMPRAISLLQEEVRRLAGTDRWITGNAATVDALAAEGFDFGSRDAQEMLLQAVGRKGDGPSQLALALIAKGVSLDRSFTVLRGKTRPLGVGVALAAARNGKKNLLDRIGPTWLARAPARDVSRVLAEDIGGCDPEVIRLLVKAGADPNALSDGAAALHRLESGLGGCDGASSLQRRAAAQVLLALGANPNLRDKNGQTPLFGLSDADLAEILIRAGAQVNARTSRGGQAVLSARTDGVVLALLLAGANRWAMDDFGMSLNDLVKRYDMPATRAWLYLHDLRG
jgi:hypothetical protein